MKNKIVKGGLAILVRQLISFPLNTLGVMLTSKILAPYDFGVQAIIVPIVALANMFTDLGTSQALIQAKHEPSLSQLKRIQYLKLFMAALFTGGLFFSSFRLTSFFNLPSSLMLLFPVSGAIGWLQSQRAYQSVALQRRVDWHILARIELTEITTYNVVLILSAIFLRSAWCFAIGLGARFAVGSILLKLASHAEGIKHTDSQDPTIKPLLIFGIPLQLTTLLGILNNFVNPVITGSFVGVAGVGLVNWSSNIVSLPQVPLQPIPNFLFSVLSERNRQKQDDINTMSSILLISMVLLSFFSLLMILPIEEIIRYIFGSQWLDATDLTIIQLISNTVTLPILLIASQLMANGYSLEWLYINMINSLLLWGVTFAAAAVTGVKGYPYGLVVSSFISFALICWIANKKLGPIARWYDAVYIAVCVVLALAGSRYWTALLSNNVIEHAIYSITSGVIIFMLTLYPLLHFRRSQLYPLLALIFKKPSNEVALPSKLM